MPEAYFIKKVNKYFLNSHPQPTLSHRRCKLWKRLKGVTLAGEMLEHHGKGMAEIRFGFDAVVEDDDRACFGVLDYILGAVFWADVTIKIAAEDVPHDDAVMTLQELGLAGFQLAVWRTEETGIDHTGTVTDIVEIGDVFGGPTGKMVEGVIAYRVAGMDDHVVDLRMLADIVANTEKGGFGIKAS